MRGSALRGRPLQCPEVNAGGMGTALSLLVLAQGRHDCGGICLTRSDHGPALTSRDMVDSVILFCGGIQQMAEIEPAGPVPSEPGDPELDVREIPPPQRHG